MSAPYPPAPGRYPPPPYPPPGSPWTWAPPPGRSPAPPPGSIPSSPPPAPGPSAPPPGPAVSTPPPTDATPRRRDDRAIGGLVLVAIGLFLLVAQVVPDIGRLVPLVIGIVFLASFVVRREYGFLVAGCIVGGVGLGVALQGLVSGSDAGGVVLLSLGLGFLAIYVVSALLGLPEAHWWPLIPGGIITLVGAVVMSGRVADDVLRWWPLVLVALGVLIVARAIVNRARSVP